MTAAGGNPSRRLLLAAGLAPLLAPAAWAHRSKSALTTVEWNSANSAIEVIHRVHPHDAELALAAWQGGAAVDLTDVKQQARLMLYVEEAFRLTLDSRVLELEPVGVEVAPMDALIYREVRLKAPPEELVVDDRIFRDLFDDQTNLVNIRMGKSVRTLIFAGRDGPKRARSLV